jgi:Flp pilus assembly protein TadG
MMRRAVFPVRPERPPRSARRAGAPTERARDGVAYIWFLAMALFTISCVQFVVEIGWLALARAELQVAAEGGALAGARSWGTAVSDDPATRTAAKNFAHAVLAAHTVSGSSAELSAVSTNNDPIAMNNNLNCPGTILLGTFVNGTFSAGTSPASPDQRTCRIDVTITIESPFGFGARSVSGNATAVWDSVSQRARLVQVETFTCQ